MGETVAATGNMQLICNQQMLFQAWSVGLGSAASSQQKWLESTEYFSVIISDSREANLRGESRARGGPLKNSAATRSSTSPETPD